MIGRRMKHLAATLTAAIAATLATTAPASADDVLYDTLWMTDNQTANASLFSFISVTNDTNTADDFSLDGAYNITTVIGDFTTGATQTWAGEGVLIEFFADIGSEPNASPVALYFATESNGLTVSSIDNPWGGNQTALRFTVDLSSAGITLSEGTWWISIVAISEEVNQAYRWIRQTEYQVGGGVHVRSGGEAHGNGKSGNYGDFEWKEFAGNFGSSSHPGDVAMKIEGTPASPTCAPADLDCNGVVNVFDLLDLLAAWGPCDDCPEQECPADLDDNCTVNVFDLLELLANWG